MRLRSLALLLVVAGTPAARAAATPPADPFPVFDSIRGNVEFWRKVFAEWSLGQVAVHDVEFPAVVYEVADLPGAVAERYTDEQIDFIEDLADRWRGRLETLERKIDDGRPLDDAEKGWALEITTHAGIDAVEGARERVRTQRGVRERFRRGLEIGHRYDVELQKIFREEGLPECLALLPHVESSFQAAARSSAGAVGVWQFTRRTGRRYLAINAAIDQRLDPIAAARGAARYLREAYEKLGDWPIALTSYNHGVAGMSRAVGDHGADYEAIFRDYRGRGFGFASRNFYAEFLAAREIAAAPLDYFPEGLQPEPPFDLDRIVLEQRTTAMRLARAYDVPLDELARWNPAWSSRTVRNGYALPAGIETWLPAGTLARLEREGHEVEYTLSGWIDDRGEYVVRPGDSLSVIAATYGIALPRLRALNGLPPRSSLIRVGQRLRLSDDEAAVHVVRRGESLSAVARAHGMRVGELRELNGIAPNDSLIRAGQTLRVRTSAPAVLHVVRRGDSLIRIALSYGVDLAELLRLNRLNMGSVIHPGQSLRIPEGRRGA